MNRQISIENIPKSETPKVFISYSWDDEIHKSWVLTLADKLTANGVYVFFDRYDLRAGKDLTHFMDSSVREAKKVLLILTPNYKLKAENRQGGVGAEYSMITAEIFSNQHSDKFIPIVRLGKRNDCTPTFVKSKIDIDMSNDCKFDENFESLLQTIFEINDTPRPPLGKPRFDNTSSSQKRLNPNNSILSNSIAMHYLKQRLYDKAISAFDKAIEDNSDSSETFYYAAVSLLKGEKAFICLQTDIDKIMKYLKAAIEIEPRGIYHYFLAYIKYDFFERKCFNITPDWQETLQTAIQSGVSMADISQLSEILQVKMPECLSI